MRRPAVCLPAWAERHPYQGRVHRDAWSQADGCATAGNDVLGGLRLCDPDQHLARMRGPAAIVFGTQGEDM